MEVVYHNKKWLEVFIKNNGHIHLPGKSDLPVFIFIHGYGTSPEDLRALAESFNGEGYACDLVLLKGHARNADDLIGAKYSDWYRQIDEICAVHRSKGRKIYLVGFSLGALLAVDYASKHDIAGVLAIGTFFGPRRFMEGSIDILLRLIPGHRYIKRIHNTTKRSTREELTYNTHLPLAQMKKIIIEARRAGREGQLSCPSLFLHSVHDKVAEFIKTQKFVKCKTQKGRLVTLRGLNHFIQFDCPPHAVRDLFLEHAGLKRSADPARVEHYLSELISQYYGEHRHWTEIIFKLIVGFFTIFGALLYYTLEKVLSKSGEAPYYLISYSLILNVYLVLFSLYFYYMTRSINFIKNHIEPLLDFFPHFSMRPNRWASGRASGTMTQGATSVVTVAPLTLSFVLICYTLYSYRDLFFSLSFKNFLLKATALFTVLIFLYLIKTLRTLKQFSNIENKRAITPAETTPGFEKALAKLYHGVEPGCVVNPSGE